MSLGGVTNVRPVFIDPTIAAMLTSACNAIAAMAALEQDETNKKILGWLGHLIMTTVKPPMIVE